MNSRIATFLLVLALAGANVVTSEGLRGSRMLQESTDEETEAPLDGSFVPTEDSASFAPSEDATFVAPVEEEDLDTRVIASSFAPSVDATILDTTEDVTSPAPTTEDATSPAPTEVEEDLDTRIITTEPPEGNEDAPVAAPVEAPVAAPVAAPVQAPAEEDDEDIVEVVENPTFQVNSAIKYEFFKGQGRDVTDPELELLTMKAKTVFRKKLVECFAEKFEKVQEVDVTKVYDAEAESLELKFLINVLLAEGHGLTEHEVATCISEADWYSYIHVLMSKGIWSVNKVTFEATGKGR